MEAFNLKIYLFKDSRLPPIKIARNSQLQITAEFMDYTIPEGAKVSAFATGLFPGLVFTQDCTVDGNRVSFTPMPGFFVQGKNILQYKINNGVIPLAIDVSCEVNISATGDGATPEQVLPYVTRAENAAESADKSAKAAQDALDKTAEIAVTTPRIGENGNWFVFDAGNDSYVDTGVRAQGEPGAPGRDGSDGKPGADGAPGADGHTPVYGVDYGTPEQIDGIAKQAAEILHPEVNQIKNDLSNKLPKSPSSWEPWTAEEQAAARERIGIPGEYELIETIDETYDDFILIERDKEPDGTPYNFARAFVFITLYADSGKCENYGSGYVYDANSNNILEYRTELGSKTATGYSVSAFWQFGVGMNTVFSDWGSSGQRPYLHTHAGSVALHNATKKTCAKIVLSSFSGHVKISIFGVRA